MPQGCLLPPTAGLGGVKTQAFSVDDIRAASYAKPVPTKFPQGKSLYQYDLKVDNICDAANSITVDKRRVAELEAELAPVSAAAVKAIEQSITNAQGFTREANITSRLRHECVPGHLWIVSET